MLQKVNYLYLGRSFNLLEKNRDVFLVLSCPDASDIFGFHWLVAIIN